MSIYEIITLLVALVAVFAAWRATRQLKELTERFERLQTVTYETRADLRDLKEQLETRLSSLDVALKKANGELRFAPTMRLADLYQVEPRAESILAALHIGGCAHCAVDDSLTIDEAVKQTRTDLNRVLAALNNLPRDGSAVEIRVPNVRLEIGD